MILMRGEHVCPWWACRFFDNPVRRIFQDPERILEPYVKPGFTVIDVGAAMGYFTIPMLRMVGGKGKVIAIDVQKRMLDALWKRAMRAGLTRNLVPHLSTANDLGIHDPADFVLLFWMLHEVADQQRFLAALKSRLKPLGRILITEPFVHVTRRRFQATVDIMDGIGMTLVERPRIAFSYSALFSNNQQGG